MADDGESIFAKAGFDVPRAGGGRRSDAAAKPETRAEPSMFEAAGFKLPGAAREAAAAPESNIPTPDRFAESVAKHGVNNHPAKSTLEQVHEALDPAALIPIAGKNIAHDTLEHAIAGSMLAKEGMKEAARADYLPTMPSADPSTWTAGGLAKAAAGSLGVLASPITGPANALVARPVTALTGNPDIGDRAGFVANALVPIKTGGKAVEAAAPSTKSINKLVDAIGPENVPEAIARLRENPRLTVADVSDPVRTMTQGLIDPAQPKVHNLVAERVKERMNTLPEAVNSAYTEAMGPAPNVVTMVEGLKDRARKAGSEAIQPALKSAKPVDVSPVIAAIDKELKPGITAMMDPGTRLPLSELQQELVRFKQKLTTGSEQAFDPQSLHRIQSDMGDQAFQLSKSPNPKDRQLGQQLRGFNEKLIDQIDEASKTAHPVPAKYRDVKLETPSGQTDTTGVWFLRGDKPTFAQATFSGANATLGKMADELHSFPSKTGANAAGNPITVWYKPGAEGQAQKAVDLFAKGAPADAAGQIKYHLENAEALGYPRSAAESYVRSRFGKDAESVLGPEGPGPYREARAKFKDAKDIHEAFDAGFDTLKNRAGVKGLEDRPEAFKEWMKDATPEEVVARRLGTRADIDQKIRGAKNQALAGEVITRIEYNQEKLKMLFGDKEAGRLIRVMKDAQDEAHTNAKLLANSKTAETLAGQKALEVRKVGGGNPLQYVAPVAAEMIGQGAGLPGVGFAASLAAKALHLTGQKAGQVHDLARNFEFAKNALASGPTREAAIEQILAHPKVIGELKKRANALAAP